MATTAHTTTHADDSAQPPTANAARALRQGSGFFEIDVRDGFERTVREAVENALTRYRGASKARAGGDELEALGLCELAEQALDLVRELLCRIEGLD